MTGTDAHPPPPPSPLLSHRALFGARELRSRVARKQTNKQTHETGRSRELTVFCTFDHANRYLRNSFSTVGMKLGTKFETKPFFNFFF